MPIHSTGALTYLSVCVFHPNLTLLNAPISASPPFLFFFLQEGDAADGRGVPVVPVGLWPLTSTQSSAIKCNANSRLDHLGHQHWLTNTNYVKKKREIQDNYEKKNFITRYSTIKQQYKRIKRVMDAPTYSLNQKLNINKNIYGNFHSLLYVSILVPFCPFSSRFFLWLRHGTVHWQTEMADSVWTINKISVFGVNVVHVWKDTVLV